MLKQKLKHACSDPDMNYNLCQWHTRVRVRVRVGFDIIDRNQGPGMHTSERKRILASTIKGIK